MNDAVGLVDEIRANRTPYRGELAAASTHPWPKPSCSFALSVVKSCLWFKYLCVLRGLCGKPPLKKILFFPFSSLTSVVIVVQLLFSMVKLTTMLLGHWCLNKAQVVLLQVNSIAKYSNESAFLTLRSPQGEGGSQHFRCVCQ